MFAPEPPGQRLRECGAGGMDQDQAAAISLVHQNSVPSVQMQCKITAILRAIATRAFFDPMRLAKRVPQALSGVVVQPALVAPPKRAFRQRAESTAVGESRLSLGRRMNASGGRRTTDSRTERGAHVALAASWRPHSKRGQSEASFPGPRMAALTPLMPTATSETSSPKDRPTTTDPIISPEEAADPLKPLTLLVVFEPRGMQIRRSGCSRHPAHSWRR
jgi:hypothetical protein